MQPPSTKFLLNPLWKKIGLKRLNSKTDKTTDKHVKGSGDLSCMLFFLKCRSCEERGPFALTDGVDRNGAGLDGVRISIDCLIANFSKLRVRLGVGCVLLYGDYQLVDTCLYVT